MFRPQAVPSCRFQCDQKHSIRYGSTRLWSSSMPSSRYLGSCVLERRRLEVTQACLAFDLFSQLFWLSNFLVFCHSALFALNPWTSSLLSSSFHSSQLLSLRHASLRVGRWPRPSSPPASSRCIRHLLSRSICSHSA